MKKILISLIGLFIASSAAIVTPIAGAEEKSPVNLVLLSSFRCGNCYDVHRNIKPLINRVQKTGGIYHFVPVGTDEDHMPAVMAQLGAPEDLSAQVTDALFNSAQMLSLSMNTDLLACSAIETQVPEYDVKSCLENIYGQNTMQRQFRIDRLLNEIMSNYRSQFTLPLAVIQKNNAIVKVLSYGDYPSTPAFIDAVIHEVETNA